MSGIILVLLFILVPAEIFSQVDSVILGEPETLDLQFLIGEAMIRNPEIQAAVHQMDVMGAKVPQMNALDDPEIKFMSEEMPGFDFSRPMYRRIELMQMIRFPTKYSEQGKLALIRAEHAHHSHLEKANEVVSAIKRNGGNQVETVWPLKRLTLESAPVCMSIAS